MNNRYLEIYAQIIDRFNAKMNGMKIQRIGGNVEDLVLYVLIDGVSHNGEVWTYNTWENVDEIFFGARSIFNFFEWCYNEFNKYRPVLTDTDTVSICGKQWSVFKEIQSDSLDEMVLKMDMMGI